MKKVTITTETITITDSPKPKAEAVEIIVILDRSGSMGGLEKDVINSFNGFVKEQQAEDGEAKLTLIQFDSKYEVVYDSVDIQTVPELTSETYYARGATALYDAVGTAINSCTAKNAMVLIQTDGYENSSREFSGKDIQALIKAKEDQGWDFIFLGADIDVAVEGDKFGMASGKSFAFAKSSAGVSDAFTNMSGATSLYRGSV